MIHHRNSWNENMQNKTNLKTNGIGTHVMISSCRDLKAVLEITFNFDLKEIALCEEYIAVCSNDEFQVS